MEAASSTSLAETSASLPEPLTSEPPGLDFQHPQQALIRRGATDAATSQGSGDSAQDEKSYIAVLEDRVGVPGFPLHSLRPGYEISTLKAHAISSQLRIAWHTATIQIAAAFTDCPGSLRGQTSRKDFCEGDIVST